MSTDAKLFFTDAKLFIRMQKSIEPKPRLRSAFVHNRGRSRRDLSVNTPPQLKPTVCDFLQVQRAPALRTNLGQAGYSHDIGAFKCHQM